MGLIAIILLVIFVISALVLVLVILIQDDQGEGLGGIFGAGSASAFGPRTGNVLTRFTSIVAAVFLVTAFGVALINRTPRSGDLLERARAQQAQEAGQSNWWVEAAPAGGAVQDGTAPDAAAPGGAAADGAAEADAPAVEAPAANPPADAPAQPAQ